ncbi:molybdate ABC transporter substrate-binding protein [Neptunomonas japonica]|uniref:molybdate ABC transporter substrate-binding protein n=1 Tax=Neptunomonas japonica TaxID=417574 RepID=UPI000420AC0C|nr:molybdate ABC transporter substrate-binding protein [Neptunomonas japonica]
MKALVITLLLSAISGSVFATNVRIAVASNFTTAAQALSTAFTQKTKHSVQISSGSTGKLYIQIRHGAPFDLLLAADMDRPHKLYTEGYTNTEPLLYATGQLVLWSRTPSDVIDGIEMLSNGTVKRLAIANAKTAPYGKAAQEVLNKLTATHSSWKLIRGDNIAQTYQFAASGNVDAAFVARAQTVLNKQGFTWLVPQSLYSPIQQGAILLKHGINNPAANAFYRFLSSDEAKSVIQRYGYITR